MSKFVFAAAMAAAVVSSQAIAAEPAPLPSKPVSMKGVDFRSPAEVKDFYARLTQAAHDVCRAYEAKQNVTDADPACASKALANAVEAANKPTLTAIHQGGRVDVLYASRTVK